MSLGCCLDIRLTASKKAVHMKADMKKFKHLFILTAFFFASSAFADCKGTWELGVLARSNLDHLLISEKNQTHRLSTQWLKRLVEIREKIDAASGIYTRLLICNSDAVNAFAWKSADQNMTALTLGMIDLLRNDYDAYAALLGHENSHLVQNHMQQKSDRAIGLGLLQLLLGVALEVTIQQGTGVKGLGSDLASLGNQAIGASYSRDTEREADRLGIRYAFEAGFDPSGAIRLHRYLSANANFLSTHPSSDDRVSILAEEIRLLTSKKINSTLTAVNAEEDKKSDKKLLKNVGSGQVILVNSRLGYYIATQVELIAPVPGMRVGIADAGGELQGTIHRVVDGYFSVVPDRSISSYSLGDKVVYK